MSCRLSHSQRVFFMLALTFFLLVACNQTPKEAPSLTDEVALVESGALPTEPPIATVEPTATATTVPTETPTATHTATATHTPTETATHTATATATATLEPTSTHTPTSVPVLPSATATTTPTLPPAAPLPAQGGAPSGPNLLSDPGFEAGGGIWQQRMGTPADIVMQEIGSGFVRSGQFAARVLAEQAVDGLTVGQTYRFGIWGKIWHSGEGTYNAPARVRVCANGHNNNLINAATTVCGPWSSPLNQWQFLTVDFATANQRVFVFADREWLTVDNIPPSSEIVWDDGILGVSPTQVEVLPEFTPEPEKSVPVRQANQPFNADALKGNMNTLRSNIEQMGGLLDRLVRGGRETCSDFMEYYTFAVTTPFYDGVPEDWAYFHNEYRFAAERVTETSEAIFTTCNDGNGVVTELNYGVARTGVNEALAQLGPAVDAVNQR